MSQRPKWKMVHFQIDEEEWSRVLEILSKRGYASASEFFREVARRLIENNSEQTLPKQTLNGISMPTGSGKR